MGWFRKTRISENLLSPGDDYDGSVIVKSNLNSNGKSELRLLRDPEFLCQSSHGTNELRKGAIRGSG
jgi:hypothetical protein